MSQAEFPFCAVIFVDLLRDAHRCHFVLSHYIRCVLNESLVPDDARVEEEILARVGSLL